jgi:hypothetical protein
MVGLGSSKLGHRSGMPSAAAGVLEAFSEYSSFLAAFDVKNGFFVVAARNGIIVEDNLFADESDAKAAVFSLATLPDWGIVVAPGNWALPRALEKHLEDLALSGSRGGLRPISHFKGNALTLILLALFVLSGFYFFEKPVAQMFAVRPPQVAKINPQLAEAYKKQLAEKERELDSQYQMPRAVAAEIKMPYESIPDKYERMQQCWQAIGFLMQPIPGWAQLSAECGTSQASAVVRRGFGTLADMYAVLTNIMPGVLVEEKSDSEVLITVELPKLAPAPSASALDADSVARELNSLFQRIDRQADIKTGSEEIGAGESVMEVNFVSVSAASKLKPTEFIKIFDDADGVEITEVRWDNRARTWNYEVKAYVK